MGAHLLEEPLEKAGRKAVRNISLKGFLLMPSPLVQRRDGLREQSLGEDVMFLPPQPMVVYPSESLAKVILVAVFVAPMVEVA